MAETNPAGTVADASSEMSVSISCNDECQGDGDRPWTTAISGAWPGWDCVTALSPGIDHSRGLWLGFSGGP